MSHGYTMVCHVKWRTGRTWEIQTFVNAGSMLPTCPYFVLCIIIYCVFNFVTVN